VSNAASKTKNHVDVLVIGAGLSGIAAGYHLKTECPGKTFAILEGRSAIGGTWDLFKYPGIRSDSDMYTLGYSFRPWKGARAIADGPSILSYIRETAKEHALEEKIRFGHRVERASWSSQTATWTVEARVASPERDGASAARGDANGATEVVTFTCNFLFMCTGYYDYERGYTPEFPGLERFGGRVVHPQKWTEDIDVKGKRVLVIGSGATAVTLVPELAKTAARVTMLQRSPTYIVSLPGVDKVAEWLRAKLPSESAYDVTRWKNVALSSAMYNFCRAFPARSKKFLLKNVRRQLGADYDVDTHFTPTYAPWDQRLCLVPDGDLFKAIKSGRAEVVTDRIKTFTETGVALESGKTLDADIVVTATGLKLQLFGGMGLVVDSKPVELKNTTNYKGAMLSDVPNFAVALGYTNASWTLKCDLVCEYVCRILKHMDKHHYRIVTPRTGGEQGTAPLLDLASGYVHRAISEMPKQGAKHPWRLRQNYLLDLMTLRFGAVVDPALEFRAA
jgi:monooxygenase